MSDVADKVDATVSNGILKVTLPKEPGAKAKAVTVKVKQRNSIRRADRYRVPIPHMGDDAALLQRRSTAS
jgi:HSP20 family molecular chaperone IbpA